MYKTAYDTTYLQLQRTNLTLLTKRLAEARVTSAQFQEAVSPNKQPITDIPLLTVVPGLADIPFFIHPIVIKTADNHESVVVDTRGAMRLQRDGAVFIQSQLDYNFAVVRGALQCIWNDPADQVGVRNLGVTPMRLFSRWITNAISVRRSLTLDAQLRVGIIAAYFYFGLFHSMDDQRLTEADLSRCVTNISKATFADPKQVYDIIGTDVTALNIPLLLNVNDFCNALITHSQSLALEAIDSSFVYLVTGGSWFGANAREILAVALEHPPTWVSIVYTAAYERGFRNTGIGRMVQDMRKDDSEAFTDIVTNLVYGRTKK